MPISKAQVLNDMKTLAFAMVAALLVGCQGLRPAPVHMAFSGGDGSCCEKAVVIEHAKYRETALVAESIWLEQKYPGCRRISEGSMSLTGKTYSIVALSTTDGQERKVYFDSTNFR